MLEDTAGVWCSPLLMPGSCVARPFCVKLVYAWELCCSAVFSVDSLDASGAQVTYVRSVGVYAHWFTYNIVGVYAHLRLAVCVAQQFWSRWSTVSLIL